MAGRAVQGPEGGVRSGSRPGAGGAGSRGRVWRGDRLARRGQWGNLRIEGTAAANRTITVDGVAMGTSDGAGRFRADRAGFPAPADCTVAVNDGSATAATATLAGCTVSAPPPSTIPSLVALTLSQTTVVGGTPVTATVSLTASAPTGGVVVWLSSNNPTAATVPPSVTVPAGSTAAPLT